MVSVVYGPITGNKINAMTETVKGVGTVCVGRKIIKKFAQNIPTGRFLVKIRVGMF